MQKDPSFDSEHTNNSNGLSFSRYGKTLDKTNFNTNKKGSELFLIIIIQVNST